MQKQEKNSSTAETFDLISTLKEYFRYWKLFVALLSFSVLIATILYLTTSSKYSVTSSIILKENDNSANTGSLAGLEDLGLISTTSNIDNEIAVFKSPDLMSEVVKSLEIQTTYWENVGLRKTELYKETPFFVMLEGLVLKSTENVELNIEVSKETIYAKGVYKYEGGEAEFSSALEKLPGYIDLPNKGGRLFISKNEAIQKEFTSTYYVKIHSVEDIAISIIKNLSVLVETKNASVLNMNIIAENKDKGKDILMELVKKYNEDNVKEKNQIAFSTSIFINERLRDIAVELGSVEKDVENYKQGEGITNLTAETQLYIEQTGFNEQKKVEIETQLGIVNMIEGYIGKSENKNKPIPNIGITDPALVEAITKYNTKLLEYEQVRASMGDGNPMKKQLLDELSQMHRNIEQSVFSVKTAMVLSKKNLDIQNSSILSKIHSLPKQERGLLEKMRQQQIKENLYLFLLQKREETNITMAANADKAKMIIKPRLILQVAPDLMKIYAFSLLIGLLLGMAIVYMKGLFRVTISSRKELEELTSISIIGQISKNEGGESIVVDKGAKSSLVELFRNLRNGIGFVLGNREKFVVMITSTIAGEGKSFVGSNLAVSFALNAKKVIILGLDIRNPQLVHNFGISSSKGITSYLNGDVDNWRELVRPYDKQPNLHIIPAGVVPPNPNELLMNPLLNQLIDEVKEEYDIVILDTAPVGIISDTYLLAKYPDITLYIVREGYTHRDSATFINEQKETDRFSNMYLVLNEVDKKSDNYRYGYGRTYGYGDEK